MNGWKAQSGSRISYTRDLGSLITAAIVLHFYAHDYVWQVEVRGATVRRLERSDGTAETWLWGERNEAMKAAEKFAEWLRTEKELAA